MSRLAMKALAAATLSLLALGANAQDLLIRNAKVHTAGAQGTLEIADVLKVTERTVRRDWRKARAFLFSHLGEGELPEQW